MVRLYCGTHPLSDTAKIVNDSVVHGYNGYHGDVYVRLSRLCINAASCKWG